MPLKIAILGAGPGGLTLSSLLHKSSLPCSITTFDLRPPQTPEFLSIPSGCLNLNVESGQLALQNCGLLEQFKNLTADCEEELIVADCKGEVRYKDTGDGGRPEIARSVLMDLLHGSLPPGAVRWDHKIISVVPNTSSSTDRKRKWLVNYEIPNSTTNLQESFDLVVGADGAWSRVRPLLTDIKPHYTTIQSIVFAIPQITTRYPSLAAMIGGGTYWSNAHGKSVMAQRASLSSAVIYIMLSHPCETYLSTLASLSPSELKHELLTKDEFLGGYGDAVKELVEVGCVDDANVVCRPLYMLPVGHTWDSGKDKQGVTLLGDAAHLMTPFAGEGVNCAMLDALELARGIEASVGSEANINLSHTTSTEETNHHLNNLYQAILTFEQGMWSRTSLLAAESFQNMEMIFGDEKAPDGVVEWFKSYGPPPEELKV